MHKHLEKKNMSDYQVHTFGYGKGHDEEILNSIASFQNGNFYYIENNSYVDECFLACLGNLMSSLGKNAQIKVFMGEGVQIKKKYGLSWENKAKVDCING